MWNNKRMLLALYCFVLPALYAAAESGMVEADGISQDLLAQQYDKLSPSICILSYSYELTNPGSGEKTKSMNSAMGLIVSSGGLIMARGHMAVENVEPFNIRVKVRRGGEEKEYAGKLLKKPDDINVCFIQIESAEALNLPAVHFTRGKSLRVGEPLILLGILGETLDFSPVARTVRVGAILNEPRTTYALDEPILPLGLVGGPLVTRQGQVAGVLGYDLSMNEGGDLYVRSGYPLIYQSDLFAKYIVNPPTETTPKEDAWLGVFTQPLTDDLAEYWNLEKNGGVVVATLVPGAPGEKSGLQRGDVVTSFNNVRVKAKQNREVVAFTKLVREAGIGKPVPIKVLRNGQPVELSVTLVERPKSARDASEFEDEVFGLTVHEITTDLRIRLNLPEDVNGVIVWRVKSGSWAALGNIRPGVIILRLGEHPVTNLEDFKLAVARVTEARPSEVAVFARVGARTGFFRMNPRWEGNVAK